MLSNSLLIGIYFLIRKTQGICPLSSKKQKDALEMGMDHNFGAFHNVDGFGFNDAEGSDRNPVGSGFGNHPFGNHDSYYGYKDNYLPGKHGFDCNAFGLGSLNHSYSKNFDGTFYGRSDHDPFINHTLGDFGVSSVKHGIDYDSRSTWSGPWGFRRGHGMSGSRAELVAANGGGESIRGLAANGASLSLGTHSPLGGGGITVGGISISGAHGSIFRFTQYSSEAVITNYIRTFGSSKLFIFTPMIDALFKVTLVSTTKGYHPQLKLMEINKGGGEKYIELSGEDKENGLYASKYYLKNGSEYLIEIGVSAKIDFTPFEDIEHGGFICLITSEKKAFQQILAEEDYRISLWGKSTIVPLQNTKAMELSGDGQRQGSCALDYSVTAYYNEPKQSITIFFHNGSIFSSGLSTSFTEAASVEFQCNHSPPVNRVFSGEETGRAFFEFLVQCKSACDIMDLLK